MVNKTAIGRMKVQHLRELDELDNKLKSVERQKAEILKQLELKKKEIKAKELLPPLELQPSHYMGMSGCNEVYSGEYFKHSDVVEYKEKAEALLEMYLSLKEDFDALQRNNS